MKKIIMDPYDVHLVTNYSLGHCRRIIRKIKSEKNKLKHIGIDCDFSQFVLEKNLISMDESFEEYIFFQIFIFNIGFLIDCHVQMQICQSLYI